MRKGQDLEKRLCGEYFERKGRKTKKEGPIEKSSKNILERCTASLNKLQAGIKRMRYDHRQKPSPKEKNSKRLDTPKRYSSVLTSVRM